MGEELKGGKQQIDYLYVVTANPGGLGQWVTTIISWVQKEGSERQDCIKPKFVPPFSGGGLQGCFCFCFHVYSDYLLITEEGSKSPHARQYLHCTEPHISLATGTSMFTQFLKLQWD